MKARVDWLALFAEATRAQAAAYAPYSGFKVGAALMASSGEIFSGCNLENASYGLTICAERAAVSAAVVAGHTDFLALAVVGGSQPVAPCGACRQVLAEFGSSLAICSRGDDGDETLWELADLLPNPFRDFRKQ
jgi:cytidine deaminase